MKIKYKALISCLIFTLPLQAINPNPYANGYGKAETKEEFFQLLKSDIEHAQERAAAGDPDAYRYVAKRLDAGFKHSWIEKNPGKALLCGVAIVVALYVILPSRH